MNERLASIIAVDKNKCVSCHACIAACPVKYCNNGSAEAVSVNSDLCIGCGSCIKACSHEARSYIDDSTAFFHDLGNVPMVAIVAPAVAANFPNQYLRLNGWMKRSGIEAAFDVSFGAELTIKSYLEHIKANKPKMVISQPCPAIVTYIQIYQPELLDYLAPADSPMLHTIKMIKEFYPHFRNHRVAVISPCVAKKREFDETGFGDYNVTFHSIHNHFQDNHLSLTSFDEVDYDNPPAERAVLFSTPGGLLRTAEREIPEAAGFSRKIEGPHSIYNYLKKLPDTLRSGFNPLLVDCLNCEMGCNGGTGTDSSEKSPDEIEHLVEQRKHKMLQLYKEKGILGVAKGKKALERRAL
jgi:iron only hydrogenase large subunit-like protein